MQRVLSKRAKMASARLALAALLVPIVGLSAAPLQAQTSPYVAPEARVVEPARPVAVIIPQERIATTVELGRIMPSTGGLIGALLDDRPERLAQNAAAKAEVQAAPLVAALDGFDAAALATEATAKVLAEADWLGAGPPDVLLGESIATTQVEGEDAGGDSTVSMTYNIGSFHEEANDTAGAKRWGEVRDDLVAGFASTHPDAAELASITWRYRMSADFTNVQVIADVALREAGSSREHYAQQLISIVKLRRPTFVEEDNVAIWAANDGALAREALTLAFARAGEVLPAVLALDADGYETATDRKRESATSAGFHGPILLRDDTGPVFWAKDGDQRLDAFVTVQTIRN